MSDPRPIPEEASNRSVGLLGPLAEVACQWCQRVHCEAAADTRVIRWRCRKCHKWCEWRGYMAA